MIIRTKNELEFCIMADYMMNTGKFQLSFKEKVLSYFIPQYKILRYLKLMRKCQYYNHKRGFCKRAYYNHLYALVAGSLGFSIHYDVFGYGLTINHYGTIVVGKTNKIGNLCLIDTSTNIGAADSIIGDNLYVAPGVKIIKHVQIGDNVMIGANSVVTKSFINGNCVIVGVPAEIKKPSIPWYLREGGEPQRRVEAIDNLKSKMGVF